MNKRSKIFIIMLVILTAFLIESVGAVQAAYQQIAEPFWVPVFQQDFSAADQPVENRPDVGSETAGTTSVNRSLDEKGYHWEIVSSGGQYVTLPISNLVFPSEFQYEIRLTLQLPDVAKTGCAGFALGNAEQTFQTFLLCNDSTYAIYRNQGGQWTPTIDFAKADFEPEKLLEIRVVLNKGWADLYLGEKLLDTSELGLVPAYLALFAQPIQPQPTVFTFSKLVVSTATADGDSNPFGDSVPDEIARTIRLLEKKDRLPGGVSGDYALAKDNNQSLAKMGYFQSNMSGLNHKNLLLQSNIEWKSAYNRPDYKNSGCGFTFRAQNNDSFMQVYIALDGNIYLKGVRNGVEVPLIAYNYGNWSLEGKGTLTLVASDAKLSVLYNNQLLGTVTDATWIASGDAGFTVWSGTNFETGISCAFTENHLYQFVE